MATTGTYGFQPSAGEVLLNAFSRIGIRGPMLNADMMQAARAEANFLQVEWSNKGPNLWDVDLQSVPLVAGTATYAVPPETVMILDAYITTTSAPGASNDRIILPVSRTEYASYPDKMKPAPPTCYWFDRLIAPTITLWAVPDNSASYVLNYYRYRQIQDAALAGGLNLELPYLWLDAATAGMSHRLSRHNFANLPAQIAFQMEQARKVDAQEAYGIAAEQNTENVPLYIAPMLFGYYQ